MDIWRFANDFSQYHHTAKNTIHILQCTLHVAFCRQVRTLYVASYSSDENSTEQWNSAHTTFTAWPHTSTNRLMNLLCCGTYRLQVPWLLQNIYTYRACLFQAWNGVQAFPLLMTSFLGLVGANCCIEASIISVPAAESHVGSHVGW